MDRPKVLITVPEPLRGTIVTEEALAKLRGFAQATMNDDGRNWTGSEIADRLPGVQAMITGWGIVRLTSEVLARADPLRIVAHAAGSVRGLVTDALFDRGILVTHAASRIADAVAEFSLLMAMMGLRRPHDLNTGMKEGVAWPDRSAMPRHEIAGKRVGLLGMGYVGRRVAALFGAVGAEVWAYDPYLSPEEAAELGVRKADLHQLLRECKVVSVHLPVTGETHHMLGSDELALIQDGAVFVNTARAWVIDQGAMVKELAKGRFWAALDVFDREPLPTDSPLREMDNVFLTPHSAGYTLESHSGLMPLMIDELERFFKGEPLRHQVSREMLTTMA